VLGTPEIDADIPVAGQALRFSATVDVRPEIALGDLGGIEVPRPVVDVTEAEVDATLTAMRESAAQLRPLDREVIEAGDVVTVDVTSRLDGGEPMRREGVLIEAGAGTFPSALERQLVGQRRGTRLDLEVPYPADYPNAGLAGRTAAFEVQIHDLREKEVPPLDDDFARDHGHADSLAALRERLRAELEGQATERADQAVRRSLVDRLLERTPFDVPPALVAARIDATIEALDLRLPEGVDRDSARERLRARLAPGAEREVRGDLLLDAVAAREGIDVTDEEVEAEIEALAARHRETPERVRALYQRPEAKGVLRARLRRDRAMQRLLSSARIVPASASSEVAPGIQSR
jgi:trigger factor